MNFSMLNFSSMLVITIILLVHNMKHFLYFVLVTIIVITVFNALLWAGVFQILIKIFKSVSKLFLTLCVDKLTCKIKTANQNNASFNLGI